MSRQSVSFFANDFAGRVASKIIQTGPSLRESVVQILDTLWFVGVFSVTTLVLLAQAAIGYLPEGDMVVVNDASHLVGRDRVTVIVSSARQTSQGFLIFAHLAEGGPSALPQNQAVTVS